MLLTEQEIDDLSREMVKGCKSVNWLAQKIESAVLEKLKAQEPVAFTNSAQLGYVKDGMHPDIPLAMWATNTTYPVRRKTSSKRSVAKRHLGGAGELGRGGRQ